MDRGEEMKTVVIYKSNTGFTKKYAEWIANELSADIFDVSKVTDKIFATYDTVIYGGSLHAVGINGVKFITQNLDKLNNKKIVVFATGASPARNETIDEVRTRNFAVDEQNRIKFFYLRGGFDYSKLRLYDKFLMTLLRWKLERKKKLTSDESGMLGSYNKQVDFTKKENIGQIIRYVNS